MKNKKKEEGNKILGFQMQLLCHTLYDINITLIGTENFRFLDASFMSFYS